MELLTNYTFEEEAIIVQSAKKRKEEIREERKHKEKQFITRGNSVQQYFLRISSSHKKKFILRLMEQIRSLSSVLEILHVMSLGHAKMTIYADTDPETNFIHDKLVLDHDRMLDLKVLKETMDADTAWFATLDDSYQSTLVTNLIRLSAGVVKRKLYLAIFHIYYLKLREFRESQQEFVIKDFRIGEFQSSNQIIIEEDENEYDAKHPETVEVERQRKKWDDMITKYRTDVELARMEQKELMEFLKSESKVSKQQSKADVKSKKDKKTTNAKNTMQDLDLIQLLPIWIVKKIFRYLDEKTLLSIKRVNNYWAYTVQDLLKELKTRQRLNSHLESLKNNLDPEVLENTLKSLSDERLLKKSLEKKNGVYYEIGAIPKEIVPKCKNMVETSLLSDFVKEENMFPTGDLVSFPRLIKEDLAIYKHRTCSLQDVNVKFDVQNEIERQRSFLTYSLASIVTSMIINVNEDDLSDW